MLSVVLVGEQPMSLLEFQRRRRRRNCQ